MDDRLTERDLPTVAIMLSLAGTVFMSPWLHDDDVKDGNLEPTHRGLIIASSIVLTSGLVMSAWTNSHLPLILGVFLTVIYVSGIEYVARQNAGCS